MYCSDFALTSHVKDVQTPCLTTTANKVHREMTRRLLDCRGDGSDQRAQSEQDPECPHRFTDLSRPFSSRNEARPSLVPRAGWEFRAARRLQVQWRQDRWRGCGGPGRMVEASSADRLAMLRCLQSQHSSVIAKPHINVTYLMAIAIGVLMPFEMVASIVVDPGRYFTTSFAPTLATHRLP